jgi:hypothetical protein
MKKIIAIGLVILIIGIATFGNATSNKIISNEKKLSLESSPVKICPLSRIKLNNNSTINIFTYVLRVPILTFNKLFLPTKCFIFGFTDIKILTGTLTVKPLIEQDIELHPGDTLTITGFIGKGEAVSGETWRSSRFKSLSGLGRNVILNNY